MTRGFVHKKGEDVKTDCSVDSSLGTTLSSAHMAICWFMCLKPNTSLFCWLSPEEKETFDPCCSMAYTCDQKKGNIQSFHALFSSGRATAWMGAWSLVEHWHLRNAVGAFSLVVSNMTTKITGIFWQGPPLHLYIIIQNNKIWATWRDQTLASGLYGNMNGPSWQELLHQITHTVHPQRPLFSGRKNAICLSYKAPPDENFHYWDTSGSVPFFGHVKGIFENFSTLLAYCRKLKPQICPTLRALFFPVSGQASIKLLSSAETCQTIHTLRDKQKALVSTWCVPGLNWSLVMLCHLAFWTGG